MISGVFCALLAGLMWGFIFIGPSIIPEYPALLQSMGRYLALGLIAMPLAWLQREQLRQLNSNDWLTAFMLTLVGNFIYYLLLTSAIKRTGAPISAVIIGMLPIVIQIFANISSYYRIDNRLSWLKIIFTIICILTGLTCVNIAELSNYGLKNFSYCNYCLGILLAIASVFCWTWYALKNANWLRNNTDKHPILWATAQALVALPIALAGYILACFWLHEKHPEFILPFGPRPWLFIGLMLAIALICSWVGALFWNIASQKLPTVILGPLIIFETLAGLCYTFLIRQTFPPVLTVFGIMLLLVSLIVMIQIGINKT